MKRIPLPITPLLIGAPTLSCPLVAFALQVCCFCCRTMCHLSCICHAVFCSQLLKALLFTWRGMVASEARCTQLQLQLGCPDHFGLLPVALYDLWRCNSFAFIIPDLLPSPFMVRYNYSPRGPCFFFNFSRYL